MASRDSTLIIPVLGFELLNMLERINKSETDRKRKAEGNKKCRGKNAIENFIYFIYRWGKIT